MGKYAQNIMKSNNAKYLKKNILKMGKSAQNIEEYVSIIFVKELHIQATYLLPLKM